MKTIIMAIGILLAGTATFAQTKKMPPKTTQTKTVTKYTCTMHPEVVKNKPGNCPKCGMKLVAVKSKKTATAPKTDTTM